GDTTYTGNTARSATRRIRSDACHGQHRSKTEDCSDRSAPSRNCARSTPGGRLWTTSNRRLERYQPTSVTTEEEAEMKVGYDKPLYVLPFDHRATFSKTMFGWTGTLTPEQTAQIAAVKQIIYDAFKKAIAEGVPKERAGILVDEQFGAAILRDASQQGFITSCPA